MSFPTAKYRALFEAAAQVAGLPAWGSIPASCWLEAIALQESSGRPDASRYEPHQDRAGRPDVTSDADTPDVDDGFTEDDRSWGLMQVMGYNLR